MNDVAFMVMDLVAHGRQDLTFSFLNAYMDIPETTVASDSRTALKGSDGFMMDRRDIEIECLRRGEGKRQVKT